MTKVVNWFALLSDEEEDDVTVLVEHFTKKVGVAAAESKKKPSQNQSQQVSSEKGKGRGGHGSGRDGEKGQGRGGQGHGSGRGRVGKNEEQVYRRKYTQGSNRNGYEYDNAFRGRGGNMGRDSGRGSNENVIVDEKEGNGKTTENDSDGRQHVGHAHVRGYVNKSNNNWSEERPFRNGNRNYGGERRGYRDANHGYGGRRDWMDNAGGEQVNNAVVNVESNIATSPEGDAAPVTVEPTEVKAEEKTPEGRVKADKPFKKFEKEDEKLMTLEEYQKVFAVKRKALEALKNEERKVAADRDFEAMEMIAKKKEDALLKPETAKLKKKDSLEKDEKSRKTLSINEFLKPADGEKFFYRRPGRGHGHGGVSDDFRNGDHAELGVEFRNRDRSQRGGFSGDFRNGDRAEQGGGFRNRDRSQQGGGGGFRNQDHSQQGGGFRNRDHSQQGGFSNVNRAEQGEFKSKDLAEQGEFKNKDRVEQGGFKNKVYPGEGGRSEDKPIIQIEDQSEFPVLKGTAPAV